MMEPEEFKRILGHWGSGVAVVTTRLPDGRLCGMTANAVASVSLEPPLVLVCVERAADTHDCIRAAGVFAISVLDSDQERMARRFSGPHPDSKFEGIAFHEEVSGAPVLDAALAWADCRVTAEHDGGDHTIFIGEMLAGDAREGTPLIYYRGGYGRFAP